MRHIVLSALVCLALSACQQNTPASAPSSSATGAGKTPVAAQDPVPASTGKKEPPIKLPPAPDLSPSTTFADVASCTKAGYNDQQCSLAYSIAFAMHNADAPKYNSVAECQQLFKNCAPSAGSNSKGKAIPSMAGFSVAGQKKGQYSAPSRENPLFILPLYTSKDGKTVEIKTVMGKMVLLPVGEKLPAPPPVKGEPAPAKK